MSVKSFKPYAPGRRFMTVSSFEEITAVKPERSLVERLQKHAGRNKQGKITVRHQGGGHKRQYRVIDFKRTKDDVPAKVATIEYDPNRSARIALLFYKDGEKRYILAPNTLKVGDTILWRNVDMFRHTATAKPGFDLDLAPGAQGEVTLKNPGTLTVICRYHPNMTMRLAVEKE